MRGWHTLRLIHSGDDAASSGIRWRRAEGLKTGNHEVVTSSRITDTPGHRLVMGFNRGRKLPVSVPQKAAAANHKSDFEGVVVGEKKVKRHDRIKIVAVPSPAASLCCRICPSWSPSPHEPAPVCSAPAYSCWFSPGRTTAGVHAPERASAHPRSWWGKKYAASR